jgi:hypothetical protein
VIKRAILPHNIQRELDIQYSHVLKYNEYYDLEDIDALSGDFIHNRLLCPLLYVLHHQLIYLLRGDLE